MNQVKVFRERTRELERHLSNMNQTDCCQCGVNEGQCFLVVEIGRAPGIRVKQLAEVLQMDKSAISRSVEELVQKGYVLREISKEDRRCVSLTLTEEGQKRFQKIEEDMDASFARVFACIPKEKQALVLEALEEYNKACKKTEGCCCG